MDHIAIDLGGRESQVCIRRADGAIVRETRVATKSLPKFFTAQTSPCRVIIETSAEAFAVADAAIAAEHDVRVVASTLAPSLGVGSRRTKSDCRDARNLSEASCRMDLPSVHVPSTKSRMRKAMVTGREAMIRARTLLINAVRGFLRTQLRSVEVRTGATHTFCDRVRDALPDLPEWLERMVLSIEELNAQIAAADAELATMVEDDELCQRWMKVPGVGPLTAVLFAAVLDDPKRFPSASKVQAYLGLTPGEDSSSDRQRKIGITKAGNASMRRVLVQAAWAARRTKRGTHPMLEWMREIERRRNKQVAVTALARKMAGILFAMWRDGTDYEPRLTAKAH
jgi:transposase